MVLSSYKSSNIMRKALCLYQLKDVGRSRRLINYIETKAKGRHLKILTCKGTLRQVFIRVYRLEIQSVMLVFFDPALWTVAPLTFSLVQLPPLLCVNKYTVYTYTVCKGGGGSGGSGPQTNKHLPQSPFTGPFFRWRHLALSSMSLIFLWKWVL